MPATDVPSALIGATGDFVAACRPTDLVYFTLNVGDGDTQLLLLPATPPAAAAASSSTASAPAKLFALLEALVAAGLLREVEPLLELVVATHPHDDHISGMPALLRRFGDAHIREVWESGYYHPSGAYLDMMRELEDRNIAHLQPASGTARYLGQVKLTVLAPGIGLRSRFDSYGININNASIALKVEFPAARTYERASDRTYLKLPSDPALILGADAQTLSWSQVLVDFPQLDARQDRRHHGAAGARTAPCRWTPRCLLVVPGEDDRLEDSDAPGRGNLGQFSQQDRAQPLVLTGVRDGERDFRTIGAGHRIHRVPDDALVGPGHRDQPQGPLLVVPRQPFRRLPEEIVAHPSAESECAGSLREVTEEFEEGRLVPRADRPHPHGRAVSEDDVGLVVLFGRTLAGRPAGPAAHHQVVMPARCRRRPM